MTKSEIYIDDYVESYGNFISECCVNMTIRDLIDTCLRNGIKKGIELSNCSDSEIDKNAQILELKEKLKYYEEKENKERNERFTFMKSLAELNKQGTDIDKFYKD